MSARLILHIVLTIVLLAVGLWLYMSISNSNVLGAIGVATFWFAMLIYVFFSWLFYWIVHRFKLRVWVVMQILAVMITAVSTIALLYISREHQQQIDEQAMQDQKEDQALNSEGGQDSDSVTGADDNADTLNLSEGEELNNSASGTE